MKITRRQLKRIIEQFDSSYHPDERVSTYGPGSQVHGTSMSRQQVIDTPVDWDGLFDTLEDFILGLRTGGDADFDDDAKTAIRDQINAMLDELLY